MAAPLFFSDFLLADESAGNRVALDEATARHVARVLRMEVGDELRLTDGAGWEAQCVLEEVGKKEVVARITHRTLHPPPVPRLHLAVAFTKAPARNEWLLEKAAELGVHSILPVLAARSERERAKLERWRAILQSAMLQSGQFYAPQLAEAAPLENVLSNTAAVPHKFIAHCEADGSKTGLGATLKRGEETLILIGPEGDFNPAEIALAKSQGCIPVSLGTTRLRTETAAMAAAALFHLVNDEAA